MENTNPISLTVLFKTDQDFTKLIEDDEDLMQEYLIELLEIRRSMIKDDNKIVQYYKAKTGITDIHDLKILDTMRLSAFLVLVRCCPNVRVYLPELYKNVTDV